MNLSDEVEDFRHLATEEAKQKDPTAVIYLCCLSVAGILGNTILLDVYLHVKRKCLSTYFIAVLASIDLGISLVVIPSRIMLYYIAAPIGICGLHLSIAYTSVSASIFLFLCIAFDRYQSVCRLTRPLITTNNVKFIIIWAFLSSIYASVISPMFLKGQVTIEAKGESVTLYMRENHPCYVTALLSHPHRIWDPRFILHFSLAVCYIVIILYVIVLYSMIFKTLRETEKFRLRSKATVEPVPDEQSEVKRKLTARSCYAMSHGEDLFFNETSVVKYVKEQENQTGNGTVQTLLSESERRVGTIENHGTSQFKGSLLEHVDNENKTSKVSLNGSKQVNLGKICVSFGVDKTSNERLSSSGGTSSSNYVEEKKEDQFNFKVGKDKPINHNGVTQLDPRVADIQTFSLSTNGKHPEDPPSNENFNCSGNNIEKEKQQSEIKTINTKNKDMTLTQEGENIELPLGTESSADIPHAHFMGNDTIQDVTDKMFQKFTKKEPPPSKQMNDYAQCVPGDFKEGFTDGVLISVQTCKTETNVSNNLDYNMTSHRRVESSTKSSQTSILSSLSPSRPKASFILKNKSNYMVEKRTNNKTKNVFDIISEGTSQTTNEVLLLKFVELKHNQNLQRSHTFTKDFDVSKVYQRSDPPLRKKSEPNLFTIQTSSYSQSASQDDQPRGETIQLVQGGNNCSSTNQTSLQGPVHMSGKTMSMKKVRGPLFTKKGTVNACGPNMSTKICLRLFLVTVAYCMCWTPFYLIELGVVRYRSILLQLFFLANVMNPIIHFITSTIFRQEAAMRIKKLLAVK